MDFSKAPSRSRSYIARAETIHSVVKNFFYSIVEAIKHTFILSSKRAFASNKSLFLRSSIWPASVAKQAISCPSAEYALSDIAVVAINNSIQSYRLDEGTSVTLRIAGPTKPARVKTKGVHFTFVSSGTDPAASAKESGEGHRQAYTTVEYLSAEQRLQPHHQG